MKEEQLKITITAKNEKQKKEGLKAVINLIEIIKKLTGEEATIEITKFSK